jgi:hypothetical protein
LELERPAEQIAGGEFELRFTRESGLAEQLHACRHVTLDAQPPERETPVVAAIMCAPDRLASSADWELNFQSSQEPPGAMSVEPWPED